MRNWNFHIATLLFVMSITFSLLSQSPFMLETGADRILKLVWILPFSFLMLTTPQSFLSNRLFPFYAFIIMMVLYAGFCQVLTGNQHFTPDIYNIFISLIITMASYNYWLHYGNYTVMRNICIIMIVCGILLSAELYLNFLQSADLSSKSYAYEDKNSIGQILLCCIFLPFMFYKPNNKNIQRVIWISSIFIFIVIVMLRSRATFISALFIIYYLFAHLSSKKTKRWMVALFLLASLIILVNANLYELIINGIILGGRDTTDINSLSSNRLLAFSIAFKLIPQNLWIGSGNYYVDCLPLNILTEFGVIGLTLFAVFVIHLIYQVRKHKDESKLALTSYILLIAFLLNGLFEAYPPFGPGVKCFSLWMLYGFLLSRYNEKGEIANNSTTK